MPCSLPPEAPHVAAFDRRRFSLQPSTEGASPRSLRSVAFCQRRFVPQPSSGGTFSGSLLPEARCLPPRALLLLPLRLLPVGRSRRLRRPFFQLSSHASKGLRNRSQRAPAQFKFNNHSARAEHTTPDKTTHTQREFASLSWDVARPLFYPFRGVCLLSLPPAFA